MPQSVFQISPESAVEPIREKYGRRYSNESLEKTVRYCIEQGGSIEVFFMLGLPYETRETAMTTLNLFGLMFQKHKSFVGPERGERRFHSEIGPMILLDAGSLAFDNPREYGYRLLRTTLRDHHDAFEMTHWKDYINYETNGLSRNELVELFLEVSLRKVDIYENCGVVPSEITDTIRSTILNDYLQFVKHH
jgi:radical SAM superfamily enzyme YgiQ (UPF0313 family)